MRLSLLGLLIAGLPLQARQAEPLGKGRLVRLLTDPAVTKQQIAEIIGRSCLLFTPTWRDRTDLRTLGADAAVFGRIDDCVRRVSATAARTPAATPGAARPAPPAAAPAAPPSAARTGFVAGGGQRGRVGTRLPQPLVFEVRDANARALPGQQVAFGATNARLDTERGTTDAAGQVRVAVTLGPRAAPGTVTATIGSIRREVALTALAGPAARIVLLCGRAVASERLTMGTGGASLLRIGVQDALGNPLAVTGLRVAVGDEGVLRVAGSAGSETVGSVTLAPGTAGGTSLSVFASGVRQNYAVTVARGGAVCQ